MKAQDYKEILNLIYLCSFCPNWKEKLKEVLSGMLKKFRANDAVFFMGNQDMGGIDWANCFSLYGDKLYLTQYSNFYWRYDPLYSAQFDPRPRKTVFKTDDIIPYSEMLKIEYYNDFLRPQDQLGEMLIRLHSGNKLLGVIALQRSIKQAPYDKTDVLKARILAPYLVNALQNATLLSKINEELGLLQHWLESQSEGIVILDYALRPMYCNSVARWICLCLLEKGHKPSKHSNQLDSENFPIPPEIVQDCSGLKRRFESTKGSKCLYYEKIISAEYNKFLIKYNLTWSSQQRSSMPYFVIGLEYWTETGQNIGELIKNNCGLTKREVDIIQHVSWGLTNQEIAEELFISKFTVETHLKNIFEKTGVSNRTQLVISLPICHSEYKSL